MHPLGSPYVRDQLAMRTVLANDRRAQPEGEYVLYWMQSSHRLEENWALRLATLEADRIGRPVVIHQGLDPTYEHASDRIHTFVLEGAREIARRSRTLGYHYQFTLRHQRSEDGLEVERLAARAYLVVTDLFPTAGVLERTQRLAARAPCRVVMVDSAGVVPSALFPREEYAARTIRPKLARALELYLEPVADRPPKKAPSAALIASLDVPTLDLERCDLREEVARCEIDHGVAAVPQVGGQTTARARLAAFVSGGLSQYRERRREPVDENGSSRLSPYLHFGHIAAAEVVRAVRRQGPPAEVEAYLDEMVTWRELALNFCLRNRSYASLEALPDWARRSMDQHEHDPRGAIYSLLQLEQAETEDALWNAGQRELLATGTMHNAVRMLWGKSVVVWTKRYADALRHLLYLNDKYALDGQDPNSYANILWCFGKFDRPFAPRSVWGTIRPMSLARAREKFDADGYATRWGSGPAALPNSRRRRPRRPPTATAVGVAAD
ncbi:MAG: deoxyribodipyrimidine photolyase [Gemmatimonadaceae bacterium]